MMALSEGEALGMRSMSEVNGRVRVLLGLSVDAVVTSVHRDAAISKLVRGRGKTPAVCDRDQIVDAPARGDVMGFWPKEAVTSATGHVMRVRSGRYAALKVKDGFDKAAMEAMKAGKSQPFTPHQQDVGREYAELFVRCQSCGMKLSSLDGMGGGW